MCYTMIKTYSELITLPTFKERFDYLRIGGRVGESTFGGHRQLNQLLYRSDIWKKLRRQIMERDEIEGYTCDLAFPDRPIFSRVCIHHINPITIADVLHERSLVFDPDNLVSVAFETHEALHYGDYSLVKQDYQPRRLNDTCPWR